MTCGQQFVGFLLRDDAFLDQPCGELLANGRVAGDLRGHQGLRVRRLVLLVVTVASISDQVDDDVALETAPECQRQPNRGYRSFRIVGVDVDDRHVVALGEVAGIARRAAFARIGREPDLVVRDQVE